MEEKRVLSRAPTLLAAARSWALSHLGLQSWLFWVVNHGGPPHMARAAGEGDSGWTVLGPCTAGVREVAKSQMSVMGEGQPAFHTLPIPHNQSPGAGDAQQSLFFPSPPTPPLVLVSVNTPREDRIAPRTLAIKWSVSSASYQPCLIKEMVPSPGYLITK